MEGTRRPLKRGFSENGHNKHPTLDTLWRYAAALGRRLLLTTEAIRETRPKVGKAKPGRKA